MFELLMMATVKKVGLPMAEGIQRGFHRPAQAAIRFGRDDTVLRRFHRSVKQPFAMEAAG